MDDNYAFMIPISSDYMAGKPRDFRNDTGGPAAPGQHAPRLKPYVLGGDITERLNDYMRQAESDYAYMRERYWVENLLEFKKIVDDFSIMDLKRLPEWQHSAFIYDGEIIDQDVPGNINYGYFGTFCNIPDIVLLAGAGYAQIRAGNSDWAFWLSFFDDPRDSFRIMQGIALYGLWH